MRKTSLLCSTAQAGRARFWRCRKQMSAARAVLTTPEVLVTLDACLLPGWTTSWPTYKKRSSFCSFNLGQGGYRRHLVASEIEQLFGYVPGFTECLVECANPSSNLSKWFLCSIHLNKDSSASQTTAAKVLDIISRLPGCDGQAADAVSAYTQVINGKMLTNYLKVSRSECPDIGIRLPRHKWPKSWSSMEDPVVPLERNLYGHPMAGLLWERQFEKILLQYSWEKVSNWECLFVHREKGLFLSVWVDDIKLAGKNQNIDLMWNVSIKKSIWENQHLSLIMYTWHVLKDNVK